MIPRPFLLFMTNIILTPVSPSVSAGIDSYYEPLPRTRLPLLEYAKLMGIDPARFMGINMPRPAMGSSTMYTWTQYPWQGNGGLGRSDVATALQTAERVIEDYLNINISPDWDVDEVPYPKRGNQRRWQVASGIRPAIQVSRGMVISGGKRATSLIGQYEVEYFDLDGDGYKEAAQIVFTSDHELRELAFFPGGVAPHPGWEIRWPRTWRRNGTQYTVIFDLWYMLRPEIMYQYQQDVSNPIEAVDLATNFLEYVDIYRIYNDDSVGHVAFKWQGTSGGCCGEVGVDWDGQPTTQPGFSYVADGDNGIVQPRWASEPTYSVGPDTVEINYYSGYRSSEWLSGLTLNPIEPSMADAIRYLATARLDRDLHGGANVLSLSQDLRSDMASVSPQGNFLAISDVIQESRFGSRRGEVLAWRIVKDMPQHQVVGVF